MRQSRAGKSTDVVPTEDTVVTADIVQSASFSEAQLREATTMEDLVQMATRAYGDGGTLNAGDVMGDGFTLVKDLTPFVGKLVFILEWTFRPGSFGKNYVTLRFAVQDAPGHPIKKLVYNDGSTGICEQLASVTRDTGRYGNMVVQGGFRVSEYDTIESGEPWKPDMDPALKSGKGRTWYLNV